MKIWFWLGIHGLMGIILILTSLVLILTRNRHRNPYAAFALGILGIVNLYYVLYYSKFIFQVPYLMIVYPAIGLWGHVFLYQSFKATQYPGNNLSIKDNLHYLIPTIETLRIIYLYFWDSTKYLGTAMETEFIQRVPEEYPDSLALGVFFVISVVYISKTLFLFNGFRNWKRQRRFFLGMTFLQTTLIAVYSFWIFESNPIIHLSLPIVFSVLIPIHLIVSILYPYLYQVGLVGSKDKDFSFTRYSRSSLSRINLIHLENKIEIAIQNKFYLEEDTSLPKLAKICKITPHQLSEYLNMIRGINYPEFVRKLRIQESMRLIESQPNLNLTNIGFESGFQSTSAFYDAFKKENGLTPKEFRKKIQNFSSQFINREDKNHESG